MIKEVLGREASIHFAYQNTDTDAEPRVQAKVLDWVDLEFTETAFRPGQADVVIMSDAWKPRCTLNALGRCLK